MSIYLLMISGILCLILPVPTGSYQLEQQMEQDTNGEKLTHKETSTWSRMPDDIGTEHFHRLYDAHLDLAKDEGGEAERVTKMANLQSPNKDTDSMRNTPLSPKEKSSLTLLTIKYDATDERSEAKPPMTKCMVQLPSNKKAKEKDKESSDRKAMDERKLIKMKTAGEKLEGKSSPEIRLIGIKKYKEKLEGKTSPENSLIKVKKYKEKSGAKSCPKCNTKKKYKANTEEKISGVRPATVLKVETPEKRLKPKAKPNSDEGKSQIAELNRIYNDYLNAWKQPSRNDIPELDSQGKTIIVSGLKLSALTDLLNVIERFQQGNLVRDLVKKINKDMEPILTNQIDQDAQLVSDSRAALKGIIKNDLSGLLGNVKPSNASAAFKEILVDIKSRKSSIKTGGLYDEYKKGFSKIFNDHKSPRKSEKGTATDIKSKLKGKKPSKMCESEAAATRNRNQNYLKALETFVKMQKESNHNGGLKPYYLPKSRNRQLVHNDIPLIKAVPHEAFNRSSDSAGQLKSPGKEKENPEECNKKDVSEQAAAKLKETAPKVETQESPTDSMDDIYAGLDPRHIVNGLKALKKSSFYNLVGEYQKQVEALNKALKNKQSWWKEARNKDKSRCKKPPKRNIPMNNRPAGSILPVPFPEVLVNQAPQMGVNVLGNMANQMNVSPIEMAQRIVGQVPPAQQRLTLPPPQVQLASQPGGGTLQKAPEITCTIPYQPPDIQLQQQPQIQQEKQVEISPVLDKILQRLESIQATKCNQSTEEEDKKNMSCCFVDPADGAPCNLNGSWESLVLGVRINIKSPAPDTDKEHQKKPTCVQPKTGRVRRQCVKMNATKLKEKPNLESRKNTEIVLNVSLQETVPPRAHDLLDNLSDWQFSGHALMILGGPISLSFRKVNSSMIGHFVGYCRNCGCLDTIFGSWTFCQPSRDCQDIFMSIVDRRDMLRRYSMDERRKNRFKEQLYLGSKFAKMEKERARCELNDPSSKG